ncbi:Multiple C2 domain and transmembrane region protein 6 [Sarracenia purpurea var. burkii]
MAKLVVEVVDASDLMPKDGQGSASPFVEVDFDQQRQRTQTKSKDLNPQWNQTLIFNITNPADLPNKTIDVLIYNDRNGNGNGNGNGNHHNNFLGRVRISGASLPFSESEAMVQRYPLDKRGLFSHIKGDIALKVYILHGQFAHSDDTHNATTHHETKTREPPFQEIDIKNLDEYKPPGGETKKEQKTMKKDKDERRTFYSVGTDQGGPAPAVPPPEKPDNVEARTNFAKAGPAATVVHMQVPGMRPEFGLVETRPPVAARMGYRSGDKTATTYDLVERMQYLYVNVVKARDLPVMDMTGSLDPYVEVKLGNYKGVTNYLEKNQNPVWNKVFAFSKENLQSNMIEVTVKDKDYIGKDDFVGRVFFDIGEAPLRVPPDSPLAPQWYKLVTKKGEKVTGEIMLAVWMGTQADEAFPEAWHSDAHDISQHSLLSNTRSKVYFSPKLYYLRVHVIEAQDLVPTDKTRPPETFVKVQVGDQALLTLPSKIRNVNPVWDFELMFVVSEPFDELMMITVEERIGPGKDEVLGRLRIWVRDIPQKVDYAKFPDARWFNLLKPAIAEDEIEKKKEAKFSSKIHLRLWFDAGYHVLDESTHFSSDLQPSSKHLRKPNIGILELGILSARNLLPMKSKEGRTTDAYCVAKYGNKWIRTRTLLNTLNPRWNEQYTWEVYDPCTVITIGVFDNWHINGSREDARDQRIGKVRVRLSTLETDRIYTHYYPLLVLQPSGLKKHGELHLALRFTCTAWVNMLAQYGKPLLPKMHYVRPIPPKNIPWLRHQAMQIVAARLSRAEPPLRREIVEYMLDVDYHIWSLRRSKANFHRIMSLLSGISAVFRWSHHVCNWRNPVTTCLVHVLFLILVCYPELILPTVFLYLFVIGLWNYRFRPRQPPHMDSRLSQAENVHPDELDEEFDTFPTSLSRPTDIMRMRYDRLRSVAGRIQAVIGDLATQGERALAILSWRDPRATAIVIIIALIWAVLLYVTPFQVVAVLIGLYLLRHPRFRGKLPSVPVNFFKRLPAKSDMLL